MSKTKESFVFYKDWWNAISGMPKEIRSEVCECVIRYAFGDAEEDVDGMTAMALRFIAPQIDRDRVKYEAKCEKNRENGAAGGRMRQSAEPANAVECRRSEANATERQQTAANGSVINRTGSDNDNETENADETVNDNKKENANASESACDNGQNSPHTPAQPHMPAPEEELFKKFQSWLSVYAPTVLLFQEPLDAWGFDWLFKKYGAARMKQCAADIHNKEAYLKNRNALNTFKLWIRNVKI